jgi:HNH endonuclease
MKTRNGRIVFYRGSVKGKTPVVLACCINVGNAGCWLWGGRTNRKGYGVFMHNRKIMSAARVSYEQNVGAIPEGMHVLHTCDTPACCRPDHLLLGTNIDNIADKMAKGRHRSPKGEDHGSVKMTEEKVKAIREANRRGVTVASLSRMYQLSDSSVRDIVKERTWRHLILGKE